MDRPDARDDSPSDPETEADRPARDVRSTTRDRIRRRAAAAELEEMIDAVMSTDAVAAAGERRVILVDGFNVLHSVVLQAEREVGWWRRELRERLLRRVGEWPQAEDDIWVAFDGAQPSWSVWAEPVAKPLPRRGTGACVHSVYVESADDWIVRRARKTDHPERTVVVSADRQVAGRARSAGCEVWTPWTFMARCPSSADTTDDTTDDITDSTPSKTSDETPGTTSNGSGP